MSESAYLQSCQQWELGVVEKERIQEQEQASLELKKTKNTRLEAIPRRLAYLVDEHRREQEALRDLEDRLREKNKSSDEVTTLEREIISYRKKDCML